ncbi:MAG: porin family protein [Halobacteriovoraceae bacterium]|nr:porin family protein [Halobacteriovoraceae bacterium]
MQTTNFIKKIILILNTFLILTPLAFPNKIVKVKGNTVYFTRSGVKAKKGRTLKVYADGYEVGKIKVIKVSGKYGIAKIVEGSVAKGDQVKSGGGSRRGGKSSKGGSKSSGGGGMTFYAGLGFYIMGELEDSSGAVADFGNHNMISLGLDYAFSDTFSLLALLNYSISGTMSATNLDNTEFDSTVMEINTDVVYKFSGLVYGRGGIGVTMMDYSGEYNGTWNDSYTGFNFGVGGGLNFDFSKSLNFRVDLGYRYIKYLSTERSNPEESGSFSADGIIQSHTDLLLLVGYKF